jgi:curved DNA-binding protein CbpA
MGQAQSRIDARHIGIYQKLLAIQNPATRLQMIDTLMGDPGIIQSAKIAGIYANILQVSAAIRHGGPIPLLPGEVKQKAHQGYHPQQGQLAPHPAAFQARQPVANQLVTTTAPQQSYYQQVSKPKRSEKALNFFTACLRVLGIQEEISLTEEALKLAYKKAVMKAHPDKGGSKEAFDAVTRAYAYLIDILKLVKGSSGSKGQEAVPELNTVHEQRTSASQEWQMPAEPVKLNPKSLNLTVFNQMFEQTRIPDPDEDGYGDWLKDEDKGASQKKRVKGKNFSEDFNREVFNRMFEEENASGKGGQGQVIRFNHPQELILSQGSGVELGRDRPPDYTAAYDSGLQFTDLRAAYTKENTVTEKVSNVKVENRDFNSYKSQRERAPDMYSREEMAALNAHEIQQKQREEQRRLRAAQEHVGARDYFERMKQLVIAEK